MGVRWSPISSHVTRANDVSAGYFNRPHPADEVQLRDHRKVLYDHFIRRYYMDLMKKLMISRQVGLHFPFITIFSTTNLRIPDPARESLPPPSRRASGREEGDILHE